MGLNAGEFDQRVIIQQKLVEKNSIGEETVVWVDAISSTPDHAVWAKAIPLRGNAFFAANQQQHTVDVRFVIRERSGLTNAMRLLWKGDPYDIVSIIPGTAQYKGTLEIMAINGVRDGR